MTKSIPYPECFLGSVVNPGEYWLVSKLKTHVKEIKSLEEMLSDEMNQILTIPDPQLLLPQCCVAVENASAKGYWQRGKLMEKLENDTYKIFLVDYGSFADVEIRHLQLLKDRKYVQVEPLAFKLHLYGVVPFVITCDSKKKVSDSWPPSAEAFVRNLFSQRLLIYVKKVQIVKRTVYGDIYLVDKPDSQAFSLGKLLCIKEYAVYAESYFRRKVIESDLSTSDSSAAEKDSNTSSDLTMKLERVKQWQLSVNQYEFSPEEEASVLKSPSDSKNGVNRSLDKKEVGVTRNQSTKEKVLTVPASTSPESISSRALLSTEEEVVAEPASTSPDKIPSTLSLSRVKSSSSSGTKRPDMSPRSAEIKKEFNLVLQENFKESPTVGDDSTFGIFTLFSDSAVQPVNKFRNLNVSQDIILNLEKEGNFNDLSPIQRWAIPSIQRGHNVVMIGSAKTGKTLSYVIPLLATLQDRIQSNEVTIGNGPVAIVLCSGSRSCDVLYYMCHLLLRNNSANRNCRSSVRVEVVCGNSREKKSWVHLTNGCELLISTPHCLARLLQHRGITNLERLEYLVLDEVDVLVQEPFLSPVKVIMHQSKLSRDCQRIFCGEKWTGDLGNFVRTFAKSHSVLIGSYLEAAMYAKLKPDALVVDAGRKSQIVLDAASDKIGKYKILIVCEYTSEVVQLSKAFKAKGHAPLVAHSDMVVHEIKVLEKRWKQAKDPPIMICCDDVMHQLVIQDAEMLIHYSLPSKSKTNFGNRFSALMKGYRRDSLEVKNEKELIVLILIDDQNHYQLPHIVDFVLRLGGRVPDSVRTISHEISWRIEASKKESPICSNLMQFGECKNSRNCNRRHALVREIDSAEVPLSGLVKFVILEVHTVSHLSVRLVEIIDRSGRRCPNENLAEKLSDEMRKHYEVEENRCFVGVVKVDELCAVEVEDVHGKRFERGRIVELKKFNKLNKVVEVLVKSIDAGLLLRVSVYKLYDLPDELKKYRPQSVDVFLCNLLPNDFDRNWSEESVFSARSLFGKPLAENQFWMGRIRLSLKNSLHLEPVKLCRFLESVNTHVIDFCARRKLTTRGIAVENENHLEKLRSLCEKADIEMPSYDAEEDKSNVEMIEPQWAFLEGDLPRVEFISAESTSCLFFRLIKFRDLVTKLEKECQKEGNEMKTANNRKKWIPEIGMYCLALHEDAWNRGRIQSLEKGRALVFFIDYGDSHFADDVVPIPAKLLTQLPAQAIECCLVGLKHDSADLDKAIDEIHSFSNDGIDDLFVSVIGKSEDAQLTGGWKYVVNAINSNGVSLSRKLVESGLVEAEEDGFRLAVDLDVAPGSDWEGDASGEEDVEDVGLERVQVDQSPCGLNITDDLFDDENAQLMVEEFMACMFRQRPTERSEPPERKEDAKVPTVEETPTGKNPPNGIKCEPSRYHTPQLLWRQDHGEIRMKIMLNNVEKYKLDCTATHFLFRCFLEDKLYVANLKFFGSISPRLTEVRIKPFYFQVVLKKLCPLLWPRLPADRDKHRWIRFDVEDCGGGQISYIEEISRKAAEEIESGRIKESKVIGEISLVPSTDSEEDSDEESDAEDEEFSIFANVSAV